MPVVIEDTLIQWNPNSRNTFGTGTAGWEIVQSGLTFNTIKDALKLLKSQKEVAIFDSFVSFVTADYVDLVSVKEKKKYVTSYALQNNSEFLGMFNYHISKIKSSGVLSKLSQKWLRCEVSRGKVTT